MPEVRRERTGWRDAELSERHRRWGYNCPAVDIDFLLIEYDKCVPSALVEYKNEHAAPQRASHPTYKAMIKLGDMAQLPVFAVRYKDDFSEWKVVPLNGCAKEILPNIETMSEDEWVQLLYRLRGRDAPQSVLDGLHVEN